MKLERLKLIASTFCGYLVFVCLVYILVWSVL